MTLRILTTNNSFVTLDNQTADRPKEFTETVRNHLAMLKVTPPFDIVPGVGVKLDEDTYVVDELGEIEDSFLTFYRTQIRLYLKIRKLYWYLK